MCGCGFGFVVGAVCMFVDDCVFVWVECVVWFGVGDLWGFGVELIVAGCLHV